MACGSAPRNPPGHDNSRRFIALRSPTLWSQRSAQHIQRLGTVATGASATTLGVAGCPFAHTTRTVETMASNISSSASDCSSKGVVKTA